MSERRTELKAIRVDKLCACGGIMEFSRKIFPTWPPWYQHNCGTCNKEELFQKEYPCVEYEKTT